MVQSEHSFQQHLYQCQSRQQRRRRNAARRVRNLSLRRLQLQYVVTLLRIMTTVRTITVTGTIMIEMHTAANGSAKAIKTVLPQLQWQSNGHFEILQTRREIPKNQWQEWGEMLPMTLTMTAEWISLLRPLTFVAIESMNITKHIVIPSATAIAIAIPSINLQPRHPRIHTPITAATTTILIPTSNLGTNLRPLPNINHILIHPHTSSLPYPKMLPKKHAS